MTVIQPHHRQSSEARIASDGINEDLIQMSRRQFHETEILAFLEHAQCVPLIQVTHCKKWIDLKNHKPMLKQLIATTTTTKWNDQMMRPMLHFGVTERVE